ncbi:MAG: hypothetical protein RIQ79_1992 [Verrucomicrobiota bacterium]
MKSPVIKRTRGLPPKAGNTVSEPSGKVSAPTEDELERLRQELETRTRELETERAELGRANAVVQNSLARYTELFDCAPVGYFDLAEDGSVQLANLTAARFAGVERERLLGTPFNLLVNEEQRKEFGAFLEQVFASGCKASCELRLVKAPGRSEQAVRIEAVLASDRLSCRVMMLDITDQKKTERALRDSEAFNRATLDALGALVVVLDHEGTILASNSAWRGFASLGAADWQKVSEGRNYLKVCEKSAAGGCADGAKTLKGIREVISGKLANWSHEYPCHSPSEWRWFLCHVTRLPGVGPVRVVVAHENITPIKLAQEAQRAGAERLRLAVQAANLGLWDWDVTTNRVDFSAEWSRQLGYDSSEIGHGFDEWETRLHPDDREQALVQIKRYVDRPEGPHQAEFRLRHKNGSWRWIYTRAEMYRDAAGKPTRMMGWHIDVTEQRQLAFHALRAQRLEAIGTLAGGVAHDLNNILAPTLLVTEMMRRKTQNPELLRLVAMIEDGTRRGAHIVRQVLVFSRGSQGLRTQLHLQSMLRELRTLIQETFPREISIRFEVASELKPIRADATQIHQVLMNLCLNARDAMLPGGGALTLVARNVEVSADEATLHSPAKPGPHVLLEIKDTGHGISDKIIGLIFDPFFTTKDVGKGTGLGLSSALGIVRSHQGFITVSSEQSSGSFFRVYLPADEVSEITDPRMIEAGNLPGGMGETILVVDDEPVLRNTTKLLLEDNGYRVLTAVNGRDALRVYAEEQGVIRLMITDMIMPEMDGAKLIREIHRIAPNLPIMISTGHMEQSDPDELKGLGVLEILQKPYGADKLLAAVRRLLPATRLRE